ncbi:ATP-dependent helicase HrpB [Halioglobus sp. HI00S01]|uniref:ATP-dependent helicase HrpB n=1 Tax=Halioglobus sp. HI00S01 TaxID=1822214 RepID=UPI0007C28794|nr:ATP-dependent helicase HrpB [Halioglobus sp. HI00S01]KZX56591.1 ATP-dependent helicase HrpB [Halioglobus sp. HI00S01]
MNIPAIADLPIAQVLSELVLTLARHHELVLQAPPGAGKTTAVPLALLDERWLKGRKILMLEPRRMAARSAAARMAELLGEEVGETVGYRIRLEACVSEATRIEVITEGILTRRLQSDPGLEDVGLVIFDEFHERSLDSDLCLALCLQGRELFREEDPLKLLVMSATLDGDAVATLLDGAPVVTSKGRQYPVATHYRRTLKLQEAIAPPVTDVVLDALANSQGSALVFLPGQREIRAVARDLGARLSAYPEVDVCPLYGSLKLEQQQRAIAPAPEGRRKVVLATNVAETSLTIEGVTIVIDSGLAREPVFDPVTGITRLVTRRVSQASAEQRRGRAGRLAPGDCYRLWSEEQHGRLVNHSSPEILQADLAPLALQLLAWGVCDPQELCWLNTPPQPAWQQAISVLEQCGAVFTHPQSGLQLTPHGVRLAQVPLHPRLAHMLLVGCDIKARETACLLAAVLSERNPLGNESADIADAIALLLGERKCPERLQGWFRRVWQLARRYARIATEVHQPRGAGFDVSVEDVCGILLASAYPDRIAKQRSEDQYQLANGRSASVDRWQAIAREAWLAVADIGGDRGSSTDRIYSATRLNPAGFDGILAELVRREDLVEWDQREERFSAQRRRMVGAIQLESSPLREVSAEARGEALLGVVRRRGLDILPWDSDTLQWRARVQLLHDSVAGEGGDNPWPDLRDAALLATLEQWLGPWLEPVRKLDDFARLDLQAILTGMLAWPLPLDLERLVPERISVPSGSSIRVDYTQHPPVLAVKLQEMFGCESTPTVAYGKVSLMVHLLSPAQRPLQVTQDLAGFWRGSYQDVKKEMKGRYPKHPWPDDPLQAPATRHTKRRSDA